ncbi:MAG: spore coat protein CotJB [Bacillota bacterium]
MPSNQMTLLRQIMELQFTAVELNLFLDTHPEDERALKDMNTVVENLDRLVDQYEKMCGPLTAASEQACGTNWRWIKEPWPWEMTY